MAKIEQSWQEISVALGWLVISIVFMEILERFDCLVAFTQPLKSLLLSDPSVFSGWNRNPPFDTEAAKSLTAIFLLLTPVQIASFFMIPAKSIYPEGQTKGGAEFAATLAMIVALQALVFLWGLSINGPLKIFGKESSWGAAAAICFVTLSSSYAIRIICILLTTYKTRIQNKVE